MGRNYTIPHTHSMKTSEKNCRAVENLLSENNAYLERFKQHPLFQKLLNFKKLSAKQQEIFLTFKELFAAEFQTIVYTRRAMTHDELHKKMSAQHLKEEIGHDEMISAQLSPERTIMRDPIIDAISTWFIHKMIVLDNIEKMALMHLVLETSGDFFYPWAYQQGIFSGNSVECYIKLHVEADEKHSAIDIELLKDHSPSTYQRLHTVIERGWVMMEEMLHRVLFLINKNSVCDKKYEIVSDDITVVF